MPRKQRKERPRRKAPPAGVASTPLSSRPDLFPIVGIGASAGGLEAFRRLLKALPVNTGMAFVLVQHLDPDHESMLTHLLSHSTAMPVTEVQEGMTVEPNHVYVIPPNTTMVIREGVLHLVARAEPGAKHMPVDHFLRSLAENESSRAIGVILSGAASDGTLGLKAIKGEGGITFAQDEKTAKYDGMPRSAIAAGCVDFVLPPEDIARELTRIGRHPYLGDEFPASPDVAGGDQLRKIFALLRNVTGIDFTFYKYSTIKRRIARRMLLRKMETLEQYAKFLRENRAETEALYEDVLIHVTSFFREPETLHELKESIFPQILRSKAPTESIRIWAPGCSTGEEVYSIAIILLEVIGDRARLPAIQIFGTDVSEAALEKSRSGTYSENAVSEVSSDRLNRFFVRTDGGYQVNKTVRDMCIFARQDLVRDPPFAHLDLLSCRNVLIYMGPVLQKKAMNIFHYALKPEGYLVLGKSESMSGFSELFMPIHGKYRIYSKRATTSRPAFHLPIIERIAAEEEIRQAIPPKFDVHKEVDRIVVTQFAPPGLVTDEHLHIIQFRGNVSPFLFPAPGEASLNLTRMVRPEFALELRTAVHRARKQDIPIRKEGIVVRRNGHLFMVRLDVVPIRGDAGERFFLVLFYERPVPDAVSERSAGAKARKGQELEVVRLGRELQTNKDYLQSIIEEHEATNEELKSANEEILSSNEELQSTNEELETAKEELQSTNEELVTVNEQLQNRNLELGALSDDLANLLSGVSIPIVMLDNNSRIRRFTPLAEKLLNLRPSDVDRPIDNIRANVDIPGLEALITEVMETVSPREREIQDADGKWYALRVRPYRTVENKIDGVVMIFVDIDALKVAQKALRQQSLFSAAILASAGALVMVTDTEGQIIEFNRACEASTGYKASEVKGKYLWDELLAPEDVPRVKAVFRKVTGAHGTVHDEDQLLSRTGSRKFITWSTAALPDIDGAPSFIIRTGTDITERHAAEAALQASESALRQSRAQLQSLTAGLIRAQEEERNRISRELHDDISQRLAALGVEATTLTRGLHGDNTQKQMQGLIGRLGVIGEDVRRMAHRLHPSSLDHLGLAAAVKSLCADFHRQEDVRLRFTTRKLPRRIPPQLALTVYRIVQEAVRNVAKHSGSRTATVSLTSSDNFLVLSVRDQGRGFDPAKVRHDGLGLVNMEERVNLVGGRFVLKSRPGEGVRIEARIPLNASRREQKAGSGKKAGR